MGLALFLLVLLSVTCSSGHNWRQYSGSLIWLTFTLLACKCMGTSVSLGDGKGECLGKTLVPCMMFDECFAAGKLAAKGDMPPGMPGVHGRFPLIACSFASSALPPCKFLLAQDTKMRSITQHPKASAQARPLRGSLTLSVPRTCTVHAPSTDAPAASSTQEPAAANVQESSPALEGYEKVPISSLPKPHPKAQKTLSKSMNKSGVYKALVDTLNGVSFTVVCDDQALGWEVAQGLSKRVGWFPVSTARVLAGMHKLEVPPPVPGTGGIGHEVVSREQLLQAIGSEEALVKAELGVLQGMRTQKRVIACTLPEGALSQTDAWREVWGTFIIWVDEQDTSSTKPRTAARQLLQDRAEVMVRLKKSRGFTAGAKTPQDKAKIALDALMKDLVNYLNANPDIIERKVKYVAYGCRGDWPQVQPPEWSPVLQTFDRPYVASLQQQDQQQQGSSSTTQTIPQGLATSLA